MSAAKKTVTHTAGELAPGAAAELEATILATLPPVPDDLPGWRWEAGARGLRLANPEEGWVTKWNAPDRESGVIVEARERVATDAASAELDGLIADLEAVEARINAGIADADDRHALERILDRADVLGALGLGTQADALLRSLPPAEQTAPAPATAWQPGPDLEGVYRRRPGMAERLLVAPRDLVDGRWQPREAYDEAALAELTDSIKEHGVLEDLIALVNELDELELVTGHRRKRAALAAGGRDVPVRVVEVTLAQATEIAIISNDQRSDLTDLERGRAYEKMIAELGISEAELARRLSRPRAYLQQRRMIATAAPALQKALAEGKLGFTHARAICLGAGGDHGIQKSVVEYALKEIQAGRPDRAEALQRRAESTVLERAEKDLKKLGWKMHRVWAGNTPHVYWFAPTATPAEWTPAEMLAAVKEARRPPAEQPEIAQLTKEELAALERRSWRVDHNFAPWPALEHDGAFVFGEQALAAAAQAKADVAALVERFTAQGWTVTWKYGSTLIAKQAKPKREESCYGYDVAMKLVAQIEKGKLPPVEKSSSYTYAPVCDVCRHKNSEHKSLDGKTICVNCAPPIEAKLAAERVAIAQALEAQGVPAWLDGAPAFVADLLLADNRDHWMSAVLGIDRGWMEPDQVDQHVQALTPEQRRAALRALAEGLAWAKRPATTARHLAPATAVAAPPPAPDLPAPAAPLTFDQVVANLDRIEERWASGEAYGDDPALLDHLVDALEGLAGDETISTETYEATQRRLGELLARLDEEGVPS